jgi:hypothetical protein
MELIEGQKFDSQQAQLVEREFAYLKESSERVGRIPGRCGGCAVKAGPVQAFVRLRRHELPCVRK